MNDKQIIAQCSDRGKFKINSEIFEDENWEFLMDYFLHPIWKIGIC
jgi:hypothetical protein